jgi:hypothetical protein
LTQVTGEGSFKLAEIEYCYKEHEQQHLDFFYISDAALYKEVGYDVMERYKKQVMNAHFKKLEREKAGLIAFMEYHHINLDNVVSEEAQRLSRFRGLFAETDRLKMELSAQ